jgi:hypothetical protein
MTTQHTPGPWRRGKASDSIVSDQPVQDGPGGPDCVEYYGGHLIAESVALCNQPVLIAAPDLLETLRMVRDADDDCRRDGLQVIPEVARARIDRVIAQAEDRS